MKFALLDADKPCGPHKAVMHIDAHHHFWKYDPIQYDWISDAMSVIRRDFLPGDLKKEIDAAGIDGVVSVQARQSLVETKWLLELAGVNEFIRGVVGWIPLISASVGDTLETLIPNRKLKAVRHVLQDEDAQYMLSDDFNRGISLLKTYGLVYDILIYEQQLAASIELVDRHSQQVFVLDHVAKPKIKQNLLSPWREQITELAKRPNVYCKISGMVTEADFHAWTPQQLRPYLETVLKVFGPRRLMFGTDWPVCLVASPYAKWKQTITDFIGSLTPDETDRIMGATAIEAYKL